MGIHDFIGREKVMNKFVKYVIPLVLYCGLIFYLSSLSFNSAPSIGFSDKVLHVLVYFVLGFLFARSMNFRNSLVMVRANFIWLSTFFCLLYGLSDEVHQLFVEGRSFEPGDIMADTVGGALGSLLFVLIRGVTSSGHFGWASRFL